MKLSPLNLFKSQWLRALLFWGAIFIAVIAAAQLILPENNALKSKFFEEIFEPCYTSQDGKFFIPQRKDHPPLESKGFTVPKPTDAYRIFIVGGSVPNNLGDSVYTETFKLMLEEIYPDKTIQLLVSALPGYDSFRALRVMREIINYSPDCIIIMSGNNEFYNQKLGIKDYLRYKLRNIKLFNLRKNIPQGITTGTGTARTQSQRLIDYKANIRTMIRLAKKHAKQTIICTLPINRQACAPIYDFPTHKDYIQASIAFWNNDLNKAQKLINQFIKLNPKHPLGYLRLGQILEAKGKPKQARIFFDHTVNLDYGNQSRISPIANTAIRDLAKAENIKLADIEKLFSELNNTGHKDIEIYTDNCHMRDEYRKHIFNCLLKAISENAPQIRMSIKENRVFSWFSADRSLQGHSFLSDNTFLKIKLAIRAHPQERLDSIIEDYEEEFKLFLGQDIDWNIVDMHFGEAFRRIGKTELALKHLTRALKGGLKSAPLFISLALIADAQNDSPRALEYIQQAIKHSKSNHDELSARIFQTVIEQK